MRGRPERKRQGSGQHLDEEEGKKNASERNRTFPVLQLTWRRNVKEDFFVCVFLNSKYTFHNIHNVFAT